MASNKAAHSHSLSTESDKSSCSPPPAMPSVTDAKQRCLLLRPGNRDAKVLIVLGLGTERAGRRWDGAQDRLDVLCFEQFRFDPVPPDRSLSWWHQLHRAHAVAPYCLQKIESLGRSNVVPAAHSFPDLRIVRQQVVEVIADEGRCDFPRCSHWQRQGQRSKL